MVDEKIAKELMPRILSFGIDNVEVMSVVLKLIDVTDNGSISSGRFPKEEILDYHIYIACLACEYPLSIFEVDYKRKMENKSPLKISVIDIVKNIAREIGIDLKEFPFKKYVDKVLKMIGIDDPIKKMFWEFYNEHQNALRYRDVNMSVGLVLYCLKKDSKVLDSTTLVKIARNLHVTDIGIRQAYREMMK